jgi:catechol 2,3-dioxygenase-like lactoylglutathione lyase family enzyme
MPTMPAVTHVAVTVNDLATSVPWYTRLFGVEPVLDENTGPFHHTVYMLGNTLFGVHGFPELQSSTPTTAQASRSAIPTTSRSSCSRRRPERRR